MQKPPFVFEVGKHFEIKITQVTASRVLTVEQKKWQKNFMLNDRCKIIGADYEKLTVSVFTDNEDNSVELAIWRRDGRGAASQRCHLMINFLKELSHQVVTKKIAEAVA